MSKTTAELTGYLIKVHTGHKLRTRATFELYSEEWDSYRPFDYETETHAEEVMRQPPRMTLELADSPAVMALLNSCEGKPVAGRPLLDFLIEDGKIVDVRISDIKRR